MSHIVCMIMRQNQDTVGQIIAKKTAKKRRNNGIWVLPLYVFIYKVMEDDSNTNVHWALTDTVTTRLQTHVYRLCYYNVTHS